MQTHPDFVSISHPGGGRSGSPLHRQLQRYCEDFAGLEEDTDRYDLLLLVKRAGKAAGFSSKAVQLLDYYMAYTRDIDWEEGSRPVVYQSLTRTALDLGVSERQIQRLEQSLFEAGAIAWCDSGNHKRYGRRCPESGAILYAFGVDLTPLAQLKPELEARLQKKHAHDRQWMELKRQTSGLRAKIRSMIAELADREEGALVGEWRERYEEIAVPIRTHMGMESLEALHAGHRSLYEELWKVLEPDRNAEEIVPMPEKESRRGDKNDAHKEPTNKKPSDESDTGRQVRCFQEELTEQPELRPDGLREEGPPTKEDLILATGLQHITLKQTLNAASERFRDHIPMEPRAMNWNDLVEAAYRLRPDLHISQQSWAEACVTLGRNGAAICLLLTDRAALREKDPVLKPAAYFNTMIRRAKSRELSLQRSIFGILKREEGGQ